MWYRAWESDLILTSLIAFAGIGLLTFVLGCGYVLVKFSRWLYSPAPAAACHCEADHCLCCRACTCKEPAK